MRIKLKNIRLSKFKGIRLFDGDMNADTVTIAGDNETGKTSVFDAWLWLLFDRDSRGFKGADAAKTTNGTGYEHNLEHEVEAVILADGDQSGSFPEREIKLKKQLREKWTKPRGKAEAIFDGNTTMYWVDDVPYQAGQYKGFIDGLINEQLFNILCDPHYFSVDLDWKDRLKMLLDMAGNLTDEDVAGGDPDLAGLLSRKGARKLDDYKIMIQSQIRNLNKEIDEIPIRIAELSKSLPQSEDWAGVEAQLKDAETELAKLESQEQSAAEAIKPLLELRMKLESLRQSKNDLMARLAEKANADRNQESSRLQALTRQRQTYVNGIADREAGIPLLAKDIDRLEASNDELRQHISLIEQQRRELAMAGFQEPSDPSNYECPTCHQRLPDDDIEIKIRQMGETYEFNRQREINQLIAQRDRMAEEGKANKAKIERTKEIMAEAQTSNDIDRADLAEIDDEITRVQNMLAMTSLRMPAEFAHDPEVEELTNQILLIEAQLARPVEDLTAQIRAEKAELRKVIDGYRTILYARETAQKTRERIAELEVSHKAKANEKTILEGDIYLIERFVVERTRKLEGRINDMFNDVGFKLFKEQINGGIAECCDAVVGRTTFQKANTAGQINAGLDIINAISKHTDIHVPVFIDRRESVTAVRSIDTQAIYLQVSKNQPITILK